ncbi:GNAT family N-acetyltransferase [Kineosporia sp. R_H_3]|uniref:GNAT family N-acetyltransferase n=1 Tax=Kineosporia sp. R_H_3 TaxID=1961848 RepID=UPI00130425D4|nr:GNAT family N-acetyltransferase [Kineosporia sp. R_H_3]
MTEKQQATAPVGNTVAMLDESATSPISLELARATDAEGIQAAIELGNTCKLTIGQLPFAVYRECAAGGTLLLARKSESLIGYALYQLAKGRVRLVHLCVAPSARGKGVARLMVEEISSRHAELLGISARCRRDYDIGAVWIGLGFTARGERPGRGRDASPIVDWWRDHNHPNLFTAPDSVLVRAAIDLNVLRDLVDPSRPGSLESRALLGDEYVGRLELVRTAGLDAELDATQGALRRACLEAATTLTHVPTQSDRTLTIRDDLLAAARRRTLGYPESPQDRHDLRHVVEAAAASLNVLITRDQDLRRTLGEAASLHGLQILSPVEAMVRLDELANAEAYRPVDLQGTSWEVRRLRVEDRARLDALMNTNEGERRQEWRGLVNSLVLESVEHVGIFGSDGGVAAAYAVEVDDRQLFVRFLRVASRPEGETLARQLLFQLRQRAHGAGARVIMIADPHLPRMVRIAALNDGFVESAGHLCALTLPVVDSADVVEREAIEAARTAGIPEPPLLRPGLTATAAAELERVWWPVKIIDAELPCYLVPIQQRFSSDLLGVPRGLLPRNDDLGLQREHVYYRRTGGTPIRHPARILWYMSQGTNHAPEPSAVIGCSQLDVATDGQAEDLHSRYRHLGVWTLSQVKDAEHNGAVQALRFSNTKIFSSGLTHHTLATAFARHGRTWQPPPGPLRLEPRLFADLYNLGESG